MSTNTLALTTNLSLLFTQFLLHVSPAFPAKNTLHISLILALVLATHFVGPVSPIPADAQPYTLLWPIWLGTIEKCITAGSKSIEDTFWRVGKGEKEAVGMRGFAPRKIGWAVALLGNWRLVGWNQQARNVPAPREGGRWEFVVGQVGKFGKLLLVTDALLQLGIRLCWTAPDGSIFADSKGLTIREGENWARGFAKAAVFGAGPYFFMHMQYVALSIVAVGTGLSEVRDWPPLFGGIDEATSVRNFWGTFWHQSIRRPLTTISNTILDTLGVQKKTTIRSYAFIYLAFGISGLAHAQSMNLLPRPANITLSESTLGIMYFFLWQAVAITIEDFVGWTWKQMGRKPEDLGMWRSALGYTWVTVSMWLSLPWAADVMMRLRLTEESFLPGTVWGGVVAKIPV